MSETAKDRRMGRPPSGRGKLKAALIVKGTAEWKRWVDDYARRKGLTVAELVEALFACEAARDELDGPPGRV